jgi:hypothetical protein
MAEGRLTISRVSGGRRKDEIHIELLDYISGVVFVTALVPLEGFARALTAQGYVPCELEFRGLDRIGMKAENKTEVLTCNHRRTSREYKDEIEAAICALEVDGWKGDRNDAKNHHRWVGKNGVSVTFHRHVKV